MRNVISIIALSLILSCKSIAPAQGPNSSRPNVILVMTDDQGFADLGAHGNPYLKTPNMDAMRSESVYFENFHVSPTCAPTRASLMTGRYSLRTGIWHTIQGRSIMRNDETTMAEVFSANRYKTGIFGKWHLGDNYPYLPQNRGFEETFIHGSGGVTQSADYWGNDYFDDTYFRNGVPEKTEGYCTDVWFDNALDFIKRNKDNPFFCYIPTNAPHGPFLVDEKYAAPYRNNPDIVNPEFYGMITNADDNMGRLMKALRKWELEENTILIFMTDNGSAAGYATGKGLYVKTGFNEGLRAKKGSMYDGGHNVPFFIRWPKGNLVGGRSIKDLSAHIDVLPTLIDLCNLDEPEHLPFDGRSFAPLLRKEKKSLSPRTLFTDTQRIHYPEKWRNSSVMTQEWRLINGHELYNIVEDREQRKNIASKNPKIVEQLRNDYEAWWVSVSERFDEYVRIPLGNPNTPEVTLRSHDWSGNLAHNHAQVRSAKPGNGPWAVQVEQVGQYEIELRRWPKEADTAITEAPADGGKALTIDRVRMTIWDKEYSAEVKPGDKGITFTVQLPKGPAFLQTWLHADDQHERGAYFVYVRKV